MPDVRGSFYAYSCEEWDPCLFASANNCSAMASFTHTSSCLLRLANRTSSRCGRIASKDAGCVGLRTKQQIEGYDVRDHQRRHIDDWYCVCCA